MVGERAKPNGLLALGPSLLILLTGQFRETHFHSYVSSYENYIWWAMTIFMMGWGNRNMDKICTH